MSAPRWTYEGYWTAVLGPFSADDVVCEFDLVDPGPGLDVWLCHAEVEAWAQGGEVGDLPEEWTGYHARALGELRAALEAGEK